MIVDFADRGTADIFNGLASKVATKACPRSLWGIARRKLDRLDSVTKLDELRVPPGNRLELLRGDRQGQCSLRINDRYRICFLWTQAGPANVQIVDYH